MSLCFTAEGNHIQISRIRCPSLYLNTFIMHGGWNVRSFMVFSALEGNVSKVERTPGKEAIGDTTEGTTISFGTEARPAGGVRPAKPSATAFAIGVPNKNA